jgi:release factor glutamine methyltransferase
MMKIGEAGKWLKKQLESVYSNGEAASVATMVIEDLTGLSRQEQTSKQNEPLDVHALHQLTVTAQRLRNHEPVQQVLGYAWFYGLKLFVDRNVLIPRPETEELVEWVINDVKQKGLDVFEKKATDADQTTLLKILDVGTGSGCIALSLKNKMSRAEVWGCDSSDEALNVARRNGSALNIRVDFQGVDFLDEAQQRLLPTVDILVSNPPYIPLRDQATIAPNVLNYEPHQALFVPDDDPLVFYRALAQFAKIRLHPGGSIYMEIHEDLGNRVTGLFNEQGYTKIELRKDMQGKDRMVKVEV